MSAQPALCSRPRRNTPLLHIPTQEVIAPHLDATGHCSTSRRKRSLLHISTQEVIAPHLDATGHCSTSRRNRPLLHIPEQKVPASKCGARHRTPRGTSRQRQSCRPSPSNDQRWRSGAGYAQAWGQPPSPGHSQASGQPPGPRHSQASGQAPGPRHSQASGQPPAQGTPKRRDDRPAHPPAGPYAGGVYRPSIAVQPPSTKSWVPVTKLDASLTRYTTAPTSSSGRAHRPSALLPA